MKKSLFEKMGGTYTLVGDYYLPDIELPARGQWQPRGYTPAPGDVIFFDWEGIVGGFMEDLIIKE